MNRYLAHTPRQLSATPVRWLALALSAVVLAGCISTAEPIFSKHYTIMAVPGAAANPSAGGGNRILRIAGIDVPDWLDSTNLYYRLGYRNDARIAAYARSDWVAPPAKLLTDILERALAASMQWKAVLGPGDVADSDLTLRVQLSDFEQVFSAKTQSAGVLDATVTLIGNRANQVLAQKRFHIEKPAPSADAEGGVKALNDASHEFARRLRTWLGTAAQGK